MTLSIIIVNYNVKYFLEQCLYSVRAASKGIQAEVIVIDNDSSDGSLAYLSKKFPEVIFVENKLNSGFGRACNQGAAMSKGEFILFLNPDTLIAEDTLRICTEFFRTHKDAGALGVKMVDGHGRFLRESKRSFPSPVTSLYKLVGVSALFPSSPVFGRYHLGHLDPAEDHEVDVLAGAYMMARKQVLDQVGYFDETFFMYGEDVDLSYRIQKAGFKNYYVAQTEIIHFKGESTKRGSLNYVRMFYSAMSIFVRKHYGGARAGIFQSSIQFAIGVRAAIAAVSKFVKFIGLPFIDALMILLSFWLVKELWVNYVRTDVVLNEQLIWLAFPLFTLMYLLTAYYAGLYNKYYRQKDLLRSTVIATLVILAGYALLPEQYRFSRGILGFGALLAFMLISVVRWVMLRTKLLWPAPEENKAAFTLVAGTREEYEEVVKMLNQTGRKDSVIGRVALQKEEGALAGLNEVNEIVQPLYARELVICIGVLSYRDTIRVVQKITKGLRVRYHAHGSRSIVGSDSSGSSGEVISEAGPFNLRQHNYRRVKRLIDVLFSLFFLLLFPLALIVKKPGRFFANIIKVISGNRTWVGYATDGHGLPPLRHGVISSNGLDHGKNRTLPRENLHAIDRWYAAEYDPILDVKLIFVHYRDLGS